jgi:hypothetical protein
MSQFMATSDQTLMICSYLAMKFIENVNPYSDITSDIKMNILAAAPVYPMRPGNYVLSSEGYYRIIPNNALTANKGFYILFNNESLTYKIVFEFDAPATYVMTLDNMIAGLNYTSPMIYGTKIVNQYGTSLAPKFVSNSKIIIVTVYDASSTFTYNKFMITKVVW